LQVRLDTSHEMPAIRKAVPKKVVMCELLPLIKH